MYKKIPFIIFCGIYLTNEGSLPWVFSWRTKQTREKFIYTQNLEGCRPYWYTQFFFSEKFSVGKNNFDKNPFKIGTFLSRFLFSRLHWRGWATGGWDCDLAVRPPWSDWFVMIPSLPVGGPEVGAGWPHHRDHTVSHHICINYCRQFGPDGERRGGEMDWEGRIKNILEKECKKYYWNWNVMMLFYIYWVSTSWCPPLASHPRSQVSESWVSHYSAPLNILTSPIREGLKKGSTPYASPHIMLNE